MAISAGCESRSQVEGGTHKKIVVIDSDDRAEEY